MKSVQTIKFWFKYTKNMGTLYSDPFLFLLFDSVTCGITTLKTSCYVCMEKLSMPLHC